MVRTVTGKSSYTDTDWYGIAKSNTKIKKLGDSLIRELEKISKMEKVTKRIHSINRKIKFKNLVGRVGRNLVGRVGRDDGYKWNINSSPKNIKFRKPIRLRQDPSGQIISRSSSPRISSRSRSSSRSSSSSRSQYQPDGSLKACPLGQTRSRKGHCVKIWSRSPRRKSLKSAYELNRKTGRLRKVCPSGKKRSRKGRCVRI